MGFFEELDEQMKQQSKPKLPSGCLLISLTFSSCILWNMVYTGNREWLVIIGAVIFSILALAGVIKQIMDLFK